MSFKKQEISRDKIVVWSWRDDDYLGFLNKNKDRVAYHAKTIKLGQNAAGVSYSRAKSSMPGLQNSIPVFRMEKAAPQFLCRRDSFDDALKLIALSVNKVTPEEVQIDFDCPESDRAEYLHFLAKLRSVLPAKTKLSITALASWCFADKWLNAAATDESVAMIFCMGYGKKQILQELLKRNPDSGAGKQSIGIALGQRDTNFILRKAGSFRNADRIYFFSPLAWTQNKYEQLITEVGAQ